jgi:hypothetical protein
VQGYNAQAVTTCEQVIVAAELTQQANDFQQLHPMLSATAATLAAAGIAQRPGRLAADSGYWSITNLTQIPDAPELLIPPPKHGRHGKPRKDGKPSASKSDGLRAAMTAKLESEDGKACYAKRKETVEPVFGQIAGVRPDQGGSRRAAAPAPRAGSVRGGVEAAVRHPQPPQAVATHRRPAGCQPSDHLSRKLGEDVATSASAGYPPGAATVSFQGPGEAAATCASCLSATRWYQPVAETPRSSTGVLVLADD